METYLRKGVLWFELNIFKCMLIREWCYLRGSRKYDLVRTGVTFLEKVSLRLGFQKLKPGPEALSLPIC